MPTTTPNSSSSSPSVAPGPVPTEPTLRERAEQILQRASRFSASYGDFMAVEQQQLVRDLLAALSAADARAATVEQTIATLLLERDSAREQFDRHVEWAATVEQERDHLRMLRDQDSKQYNELSERLEAVEQERETRERQAFEAGWKHRDHDWNESVGSGKGTHTFMTPKQACAAYLAEARLPVPVHQIQQDEDKDVGS